MAKAKEMPHPFDATRQIRVGKPRHQDGVAVVRGYNTPFDMRVLGAAIKQLNGVTNVLLIEKDGNDWVKVEFDESVVKSSIAGLRYHIRKKATMLVLLMAHGDEELNALIRQSSDLATESALPKSDGTAGGEERGGLVADLTKAREIIGEIPGKVSLEEANASNGTFWIDARGNEYVAFILSRDLTEVERAQIERLAEMDYRCTGLTGSTRFHYRLGCHGIPGASKAMETMLVHILTRLGWDSGTKPSQDLPNPGHMPAGQPQVSYDGRTVTVTVRLD